MCFLPQEFIKTSLKKKKKKKGGKPSRRTEGYRLWQEPLAETLKHCSIFSHSPGCTCKSLLLQVCQIALESSSDGPSRAFCSPSSPLMPPRPTLDHLLLPPQTVKQSGSWHSAVKNWLPCKNLLKYNPMSSSGKCGHPDVHWATPWKEPAMSFLPQGSSISTKA